MTDKIIDIVSPEEKQKAKAERIIRAQTRIAAILKEENLAMNVEMVPTINLISLDEATAA